MIGVAGYRHDCILRLNAIRKTLCNTHDAQKVLPPEEAEVVERITLLKQMAGEGDELGCVVESGNTAAAVEVGADAHVLDAHDINHVVEVVDSIDDGCLGAVVAKEITVDVHLCNTARFRQRAHLVVGEVTWMTA